MGTWRLTGVLGCLACAVLPGCFFSFDNPITLQPNNSISGGVALADPRCGSSPAGVQITMLWTSGYRTHPTADGKFLFMGLPDGVYTVRYDYFDPDAGAAAGAVCSGLTPNIQLPRLLDQESDALELGTFSLAPLVTIHGFVDAGTPVVVGAFTPDQPGAPGLFESYWATSDSSGAFAMALPAGHHVVWVSSATQSAPIDLTLDGGGDVDLGGITLTAPDSGVTTGFVAGNVVLALPGFGAGADAGAIAALFGPGGSNFEINPPQLFPVSLTTQVPGIGAEMSQPLAPGGIQNIFCGLKDESHLSVVFNDIELPNLPSLVGRPTTLGQITWLSNTQFLDAGETPPPDFLDDGGADAGMTDGGRDGGTTDGGGDGGVIDGGADAGFDGGSDAGFDAGFDAGPPGWRLVGSVLNPVSSSDFTSSPVVAELDGGQGIFMEGEGLFIALATDGGFGVPYGVDPDCLEVFSAISDSTGAPLVLALGGEGVVLDSQISDGGWIESAFLTAAGGGLSVSEYGSLLAAPRPTNAWNVPASAYYVFPDPNGNAVDLAAFAAPGPANVIATYPFIDGGAISDVYSLKAAPCSAQKASRLCVLLTNYQEVFAMSIDLVTGAATEPVLVSGDYEGVPEMFVETLGDAGLFAGWIQASDGPPDVPFWIANPSVATFTCDPNTQSCPVPPQFSAGAFPNGYNEMALSLNGDPLLVLTVPDGGTYYEDAVDLTTLQSFYLPDVGYGYLPLGGYTDSKGRPVVAAFADAGGATAVDVFTYY